MTNLKKELLEEFDRDENLGKAFTILGDKIFSKNMPEISKEWNQNIKDFILKSIDRAYLQSLKDLQDAMPKEVTNSENSLQIHYGDGFNQALSEVLEAINKLKI